MHPTNRKKQTALKHLNPRGSHLGPEVLREFDQHQAHLLELLAAARAADLNRKAVPIEFFRLLKLRLGEALEFVVVHQQRHPCNKPSACGPRCRWNWRAEAFAA